MAESVMLLCHALLALTLLFLSLAHLILSTLSHLSPHHHHLPPLLLRLLHHPLLGLLPILPALLLPPSPPPLLALLPLPPLFLLLPLPFLPLPAHLLHFLLAIPLLLLSRAASLLATSFQASDLQVHAFSVASLLLLAAAAASLAAALSSPRTVQLFLAEQCLAGAGAVAALWALQSGLSLYDDSCVPAGCHPLFGAAAPTTRCDIEESRIRAVAIMDIAFFVHCAAVATVAAGVYVGVARWCGGGDGGGGAGIGRRHNGVGGSYEALPTVASAGVVAEMDQLPMKAVGKSVAQE